MCKVQYIQQQAGAKVISIQRFLDSISSFLCTHVNLRRDAVGSSVVMCGGGDVEAGHFTADVAVLDTRRWRWTGALLQVAPRPPPAPFPSPSPPRPI